MDVVDTLRHRDAILAKELNVEGREAALIERLRQIYKAQGIDVPDHVLREGVQALEEQRFGHVPAKPGLSRTLAEIYINRSKWLVPLSGALSALVLGLGAWHFGVAEPARAKAAAELHQVTEVLPEELRSVHASVLELSKDETADALAESLFQNGMVAAEDVDAKGARKAVEDLKLLKSDLASYYQVQVVYGENEPRSGVFRINDQVPGARNYYLIVEARAADGTLVTVPVADDETRAVERVSKWGQSVSEETFYAVADDKADDLIIQNNVIGEKKAGYLAPAYTVETPGGAILEW